MSGTIWWLLVLLVAVTIFAISNTTPVTVMFWQWPIYAGPLALVIVGAAVIGALGALLPAIIRNGRLRGQIRDLERERRTSEASSERPSGFPSTSSPAGRAEDTRRLP
jgi:uncharacterized integral membrane protein